MEVVGKMVMPYSKVGVIYPAQWNSKSLFVIYSRRSLWLWKLIHPRLWCWINGLIYEVENQSEKRIKIVRSDRGGEYYGRYDGSGEQRPGPFAKFLEECGIILQYIVP
ncbi:hypothetical protein AKJ16_DCAP10545, partial [Drosera capensis]